MSNDIKKITGDNKNLWSIVQEDLKDDLKSIIWNSWVKPLVFLNYSNFTLDIQTPS